MRKLILLILFFSGGLHAQNKIDSLRKLLRLGGEDTVRVMNLKNLAWQFYLRGESDSALQYNDKAMELAKKLSYKRGIASAYNVRGNVYSDLGEHSKALESFIACQKLAKEMGDRRSEASCYNLIGNVYRAYGNYIEAINNSLKALKIHEEMGNQNGIASCYNSLGLVYNLQDNYQAALRSYSMALTIKKEIGDKHAIATVLSNIGNIYHGTQFLNKALSVHLEALEIEKEIDDKKGLLSSYTNIGTIYSDMADSSIAKGDKISAIQQLTLAHENLFNGLKLAKLDDDINGQAIAELNIGHVYGRLAKFGEPAKRRAMALQYCKEGLELGYKMGEKEMIKESYSYLYEIYLSMGNYKEALESYSRYIDIKDSLVNEERTRSTVRAEMNYEFDKKETATKIEQARKEALVAQESQRQKVIILSVSGMLILGLMLAFLFVRQNKMKAEQQTLQMEQKLLRSQMNPHFIFNSLTAIQNYILKHEQKEAVKYLSSFANITRSVLENSRMEVIPLKKEISLLENYLQLQKLRFGNRFDYSIHLDPEVDPENTSIPPMLSQPFIENALEHGMRDIESGGKIEVYFTIKNGHLLFEIMDNGRGIQIADNTIKQHQSLAMAITKERVALMNKKNSKKTVFSIEEAYPGAAEFKGVKVHFSIPL